jgi:hypothetical protein
MKKATHETKSGGSLHRMVGPSESTIKRRLKELRRLIDTSKDPAEQRIAYGMESAITWAREKTVGWEAPVIIARDLAKFLHNEWPNKDSAPGSAQLLERCHTVLLYAEKALEYCPGYDQTKAMQEISHLLNEWPNDKLSHGHPTTKKETI